MLSRGSWGVVDVLCSIGQMPRSGCNFKKRNTARPVLRITRVLEPMIFVYDDKDGRLGRIRTLPDSDLGPVRTVAPMSVVRLPETGPVRRYTRPPARQSDGYRAAFDQRTLIYDVWIEDGFLKMLCPRLLNLWPILKNGLVAGDKSIRPRRRRFLRYEVLSIPLPDQPIRIELGDWSAPIIPSGVPRARFAGRNLLIAVSRNNALDWIGNWAEAHARGHGANAVILFDNGSDQYVPEEISDTLSGISGLVDHLVLSAPVPYGPPGGTKKLEVPPRFFQTAMLNLVRLHYGARARGVLSLDIDEIMRPSRVSVYDMAKNSHSGQVAFRGRWCYASASQPTSQFAHTRAVSAQKPCGPKWCVVPGSLSGRFNWTVHRLGGPLHQLSMQKRPMFWHCFQTSTSWKKDRTSTHKKAAPDPDLIADWQRLRVPNREGEP